MRFFKKFFRWLVTEPQRPSEEERNRVHPSPHIRQLL